MILEQIDKKLLDMAKESDAVLKDIYQEIDDICLYNSNRILSAFIENQVSYSDFADMNGYGNYDEGRDKLENIFASVLGCEDALVRPQIMSGTNALYLTLSALLKHGDTMISLSGDPYDSLQEMIGLYGNSTQSLKANGVKYEQIDLVNDDFDDDKNEDENEITSEKLKRSCENWDAKLIVTTNIQFFESLYHYKGRRLRKLHNLADSVIIFDEIHMLPIDYIQPCLRAIGYVTKYLNSTAILMSATMPNYDKFMERYMSGVKIENAVKDTSLFNVFDKCRYEYIGKCELASLAEKAQEYDNALIIVNKRKTARELYDICSGNKYHLSTYMTPLHRSEIIAKIKEDIKNGINTTVISTSLIEAGVDLDFKAVFREIAGIDNILQSGGRCNREGKMDMGDVFVFETDGGKGEIQLKSNITRNLFEEFDNISTDKCIEEYYSRLFAFNDDNIDKSTITSLMGENLKFDEIPFRTYAENFKFIKNQVIGIVIPHDENKDLIEQLRYGKLSVKRKLQQYSASVHIWELEEMIKEGIIEQLDCGVCILANTDYYKSDVGLTLENDVDYFV